MSSFIELTRVDNAPILLNKYHITSISKSIATPGNLVIRMNNGQTQEIVDAYEDVKEILEGKTDPCR